ncbi:outer membrane beta-barrel protein [Nibribacter ruber]|uniref:Outer membrane beta-barrel protein n=1 Tax=Nibribacter ruber TaxID=2698458 RepID=A0A6P1P0N5_9BACT|nr:outer membrane beta-barrel protein [Nibribacter ruber]QHL86943.1 outer membrane beta-barrel protein [Nibribacter ruber]
MRNSICATLICLLFASAASAQTLDSLKTSPPESKWYVGVGLSNINYFVAFKSRSSSGITYQGGNLRPWTTPHLGYRLSDRLNIEVGVGYRRSVVTSAGIYRKEEDGPSFTDEIRNDIRGWVIPVTLQYTPFNPGKRFQLYGTAKLVTVFGSVHNEYSTSGEGAKTINSEANASGVNTYFVGGLLLKYRINKRIDGYIEGNLIQKNLSVGDQSPFFHQPTLGIGLNVKL